MIRLGWLLASQSQPVVSYLHMCVSVLSATNEGFCLHGGKQGLSNQQVYSQNQSLISV